MRKQLKLLPFILVMLIGYLSYIVYIDLVEYKFKERIHNNYDLVNAEDLAKMDSLKKVSLEVEPEGLYRHSWDEDESETNCNLSWHFPKEKGRLQVSYRCNNSRTNDSLEFDASMDYYFEGSVIRFADVQGDRGIVQKEGYPFTMHNKDEFVISEFTKKDGWENYLFSEISF